MHNHGAVGGRVSALFHNCTHSSCQVDQSDMCLVPVNSSVALTISRPVQRINPGQNSVHDRDAILTR